VIALIAIVGATSIASAKLLRFIFDDLDLLAYLGLFVACWIGAGGALVPVPGVRPMSWLMIVQQGGTLDLVIVVAVAASAMVIGQSSYFLAARAAKRRRQASKLSAGTADSDTAASEAEASDRTAADDAPDAKTSTSRVGFRQRSEARIQHLVGRHGIATVLLVSALPSPFTTLATTAAAAAEMSYARFALAAACGYLILCATLALVGQGLFAGLRSVLPLG
jgi:membrane protein DedA with SNARE-associated domain